MVAIHVTSPRWSAPSACLAWALAAIRFVVAGGNLARIFILAKTTGSQGAHCSSIEGGDYSATVYYALFHALSCICILTIRHVYIPRTSLVPRPLSEFPKGSGHETNPGHECASWLAWLSFISRLHQKNRERGLVTLANYLIVLSQHIV